MAEIVAVCRNYNILKALVVMGPCRIKMFRSKTLRNITIKVVRSVSYIIILQRLFVKLCCTNYRTDLFEIDVYRNLTIQH